MSNLNDCNLSPSSTEIITIVQGELGLLSSGSSSITFIPLKSRSTISPF
jgi:hypothetical protein